MAVEIIYTIEDRSGTQGTTSVRIGGTPTNAQLNGFGAGWATALNNLIAGKILGAVAAIIANITGLTGNTVGTASDVEHVGKFEFLTDAGDRVKVNIPALGESLVNAFDADELDQGDAQVAAFITAMTDGIAVTGAVIEPCDLGEGDIVDVVFAREAFRNSGKRR